MLWALFGLVGPIITILMFLIAGDIGDGFSFAHIPFAIGVALYPLWLIGWYVMGSDSILFDIFVFGCSAAANVVFFYFYGIGIDRLRGFHPALRGGLAITIYVAAYFAVYFLFAFML